MQWGEGVKFPGTTGGTKRKNLHWEIGGFARPFSFPGFRSGICKQCITILYLPDRLSLLLCYTITLLYYYITILQLIGHRVG